MSGIGLSDSQLRAVKATWAIVEQNLNEHGIAVYVKLFNTQPEIKQMFRNVKDVPSKDLDKAAGVRAQAISFMKELSAMIENLENTDVLVIMLEKNARKHHYRKITVPQYETVLGVLNGYLRDTLGDKFTKDAADGWNGVNKAITSAVAKEYQAIESGK